jgi:hypothetical protein
MDFFYKNNTLTLSRILGAPGPVGPAGERGFPGMNLFSSNDK